MTTSANAQSEELTTTWSASAPHVRKAIAFIKRRGKVNADELVEWDRQNGRRLFDWNDQSAANDWRAHQARVFLNSFRAQFEKMRVRAFIHVREDAEADISDSGYVTVEAIAQHPGMRAQVVNDITRRMRVLASELRLWKLSPDEQQAIFDQLSEAMGGQSTRKRKAA